MDNVDAQVRYLGDVQRLELKPDDIVVLSSDVPLSLDQVERIHTHLTHAIGGNHKVLVLPNGLRLGVLSNG